jgi:peptidoglycan-N-acetylglucosamine deacetylase
LTQSRFIERVDTEKKAMALTFDDGPSGVDPVNLLNILAEKQIRCTFFLVGRGVETLPDHASRIIQRGHEIANHSYSHVDLGKLSKASVKAEIMKAESAMTNILGVDPKPFFRVPYNICNQAVLDVAGNLGYSYTISSSVVVENYNGAQDNEIIKRIMDSAGPGVIVTMDAGMRNYSEKVLLGIIKGLQDMGYSLLTISELLSLEKSHLRPMLKTGSTGAEVAQIQKSLYLLGYDHIEVDGVFGPLTEIAVRTFQLDEGLSIDGIVANNVWEAVERRLNKLITSRKTRPSVNKKELVKKNIRKILSFLK